LEIVEIKYIYIYIYIHIYIYIEDAECHFEELRAQTKMLRAQKVQLSARN
jgi:hypothetical protein